MPLEELPTEILCAISQDVAAFGPSQLAGLARTSRRLHAICESILYATDFRESGGLRSMRHGLKAGLNNVVDLCLSAGVDPNLRIESREDMVTELAHVSRTPSHRPEESSVGMIPQQHDSCLGNGETAPSPPSSENSGDQAEDDDNSGHEVWDDDNSGDEPGFYDDEPGVYDDVLGTMPFQSPDAFYWTPLHVAAAHDDIELLSLLLQHGANPNSAGRGVCACHRAPLRRTFGRSRPIHGQDAEELINRRVATRWSPLHVAVCNENLNCAKELLSHFGLARPIESDDAVLAEAHQFLDHEPSLAPLANFRPPVMDEFTLRFDPLPPLHVAVERYASVEAIEELYVILKKAGCLEGSHSGVDVLDAFGDTPYAVAAFSGRIETVGSWLRDRGADVNITIRDLEGQPRSISNALCKSGLFSDALFLLDMGVKIVISGPPHESALHLCCGDGVLRGDWPMRETEPQKEEAISVLERLVDAGADVNARADCGMTPLMSAIMYQEHDAVLTLLEGQADVGAENDQGEYALGLAVEKALIFERPAELSAALAIIQLLLDNGADPNQHSESRGPPLFRARYDIRGSPAVYYREPEQLSTPLDTARHSMASVAPLLISSGANPNFYIDKTRDVRGGDLDEQLEEFGGRSLAVSAFYQGEFDALDSLIAWGTIVTGPDYRLMMRSLTDLSVQKYGAKPGAVDALFRLLDSPSLSLRRPKEKKGIMDAWTKVLYLSVGSRPTLVQHLAPHVRLTDLCGPGGKTVLHLMAQWERKRYESPAQFDERIREMMTHLFHCGASRQIDQLDDSGRSPLYLAVERGNIPVAKHLVELGASLHTEHSSPSGPSTISPLRSTVKSYSKVRRFKIAIEMLDVSRRIHGSTVHFHKSQGLLKDLILHFGSSPFDRPRRMSSRTTKLMEKLLDIGIDVNESDEHGNTALHHLIQLLYPPWNHNLSSPGNHEDVSSSRLPIRAARNSGSTNGKGKRDPGPKRHRFKLSAKRDKEMNGHNIHFQYDRDYEYHDHVDDLPDYEKSAEGGDSDSSEITEAGETCPRNELGEAVSHDPRVASDRCRAWMSAFYCLLNHSASLTIRNNAGKTPLHYIDEVRGSQARSCPKMYRPVIPALRDYVKRPPFGTELLAKLYEADLEAKGTPVLLVHDHIHLVSMDEGGPEKAREAESEASQKGKTCWLPFWSSELAGTLAGLQEVRNHVGQG